MNERIPVDLRFAELWLELYALEQHLKLVEEQLERSSDSERQRIEDCLKKYDLTPDDSEWHLMVDEYSRNVGFVYPMVMRNSFLISMYSMCELTITEIAGLTQKKQGLEKSLDDIKGGDFLDRARKYYTHILNFELCENNLTWERLKILAGLRNAVAHQNGRLAMVKKGRKTKIEGWMKKDIGIENRWGYIFVTEVFVKETLRIVQGYLKDLVQRYKTWDDYRNVPQQAS